MADLTFDLAFEEARARLEGGADLAAFLSGLIPEIRSQVEDALRREPVTILRTDSQPNNWTDRINPSDWFYWTRLQGCLRDIRGWEPAIISSVAAESLRILGKMPDPTRPNFRGQGLVVGYVQSGKTANYTAVAARAADAGYRLIIVMSGIHDSLRNQTQARLEKELTGRLDGGVGVAAPGRRWAHLTSLDRDFDGMADPAGFLQSPAPTVAVVKKLVPILERIDRWLVNAGEALLADVPVLIIDDEADQASINTGGNRDPSVSDDVEPGDDDSAPTRTNALIRTILSRLPRVSYVAYTATPFANILINPDGNDRSVGQELFPRDFVIQLPRPAGYTGTEELFGVSAIERDVLRSVPDEHVRILRPGRAPRNAAITLTAPELPESLVDAVWDFVVAGAIRKLRGQLTQPNSMLVHVSQRIADQTRISGLIFGYLGTARDALRHDPLRIEADLLRAWERNINGVVSPPSAADVVRAGKEVLPEVELIELNSSTGAELDFNSRPGRQIIAVGGNRLSRGLTIEGLTVSYFLRTTSMCDTLLQMGRWYGYRQGYDDLIRLWTTNGIAGWFTELALVEQSLRDSIVELNRSGLRPDQMAIRLRAHSDLLLTSTAKSRQAVEVAGSWSGEHPQTVVLPLTDLRALAANRDLAEGFVSAIAPQGNRAGGYLAKDVSAGDVIDFLDRYQLSPNVRSFDTRAVARWIRSRLDDGELVDWTVLVVSAGTAERTATLGDLQVGMPFRRRVGDDSIGILIDPRHEAADLAGGAESFRRGDRFDSEAMRESRPPTQGLFIIYPLDAIAMGVMGIDTVVAVALSLPHTADAGQAWVMNRAFLEAGHA